jgi:AraC-like DNA-binding protein
VDKFLIVKIVYAAASLQGLFLGVLLFRSKVNQPANKILAILIFILSFHLILVGFDNREFFITFPHLSRISWIIGSLYWPLIFLFVQYLTRTQPDKIWKSFWAFIPFLSFLIILLPYYLQSAEEKRMLLDNFEKASEADFGWLNQTISVLHLFFQGFSLFYYLKVEKKLREEYSVIESVRILWLKQFLILLLVATVVAVFSFFARTWNIPVLSSLYSFHFIGVVFIFYWLSYKALTHPVIFGLNPERPIPDDVVAEEKTDASQKYIKSGVEEERLTIIFHAVQDILIKDKLYRKNNLTLSELADRVNYPRHQVSQAINSQYNGNFFDLVNDYRVEDFKLLAVDPSRKHLSLLGIAQESGFNSKASFYAIFKKKTGKTPSEYLESKSEPVK